MYPYKVVSMLKIWFKNQTEITPTLKNSISARVGVTSVPASDLETIQSLVRQHQVSLRQHCSSTAKQITTREKVYNFEDAMKAAPTVGGRRIRTGRETRASTPGSAHKERWAI